MSGDNDVSGGNEATKAQAAPAAAAPAPMKTTLGLLPLLALSAALTGPASAQNGDFVLEEISVEGTGGSGAATRYKRDRLQSKKATAPLVDTPQTVTVVPEEVIEERGATDLTEVLRNTPGISIDAGENGFGAGANHVFIRGMNASGSIFTDGSRDNGSFTRDTFNLEQVEVVKGPAADNGRGGGSGYVNLVTKTPTLDNFIRGSTRVGFDDYGQARARGAVDVNQVAGDFAFRFNAMAEGGDILGRDLADSDSWGVAPSIAYGLGTDFRVILAYEHVERKGRPDWGVPINVVPGVTIPGAGPRTVYLPGDPRDTFYGGLDDFDDTKSDALLARIEYDINDSITISNQTRWSNVHRESAYQLPPAATTYRYDRENETFTNQSNLSAEFYTGTFKHNLSAGLEFSRETADSLRFPNNNPVPSQLSNVKVDTVAAYVYDNIELNEQWHINGGLRAERYSVDLESLDAVTLLPTGLGLFEDEHTTLSGKIGVVYKPRPEGSIYASYGISYLPHGSLLSNPDISRTGDNAFPGFVANADPVEAHNYEVGVKWDFFGGDLSATAAAFRTEKKKVAFHGNVGAGDPDIVYGEQVIQGVELGLAGNITSKWSVFGGVLFLDTERKHGPEVDRALQGDYGAGGTTHPDWSPVTSTNGDELAFTPNFSASLWSTYRWDNGLTLGAGVQYVGETWIGRPDDALRVIPNGKFGKLPDYFLVNLMAAYEVNDNITLRFNVDNVFNEKYLTSANWNGSWGNMGAPRTYRFGTSFRF